MRTCRAQVETVTKGYEDMKLVLSKGTMIVAAGVAAVAVGGGAYAATSSPKSTLRSSDSHALPAPSKAVAKAVAVPKQVAAKAKGKAKTVALPKTAAVAPKVPALSVLPPVAGLTCPAAPSVSNLRSALSSRWGLSLTSQSTGSVRIAGHAYCQISQTWTNPLGKVLDLRTVSVPKGMALPAVAKALGSADGVPLSLAGAQAWQSPVGAGAGVLWIQRSGVVIALSGDSLVPGAPVQPLADVVRKAG
jgi:hypothetical protein